MKTFCTPLLGLEQPQIHHIFSDFVLEAFGNPHTVCILDKQSKILDFPHWILTLKILWTVPNHLKTKCQDMFNTKYDVKLKKFNANFIFSVLYSKCENIHLYHSTDCQRICSISEPGQAWVLKRPRNGIHLQSQCRCSSVSGTGIFSSYSWLWK